MTKHHDQGNIWNEFIGGLQRHECQHGREHGSRLVGSNSISANGDQAELLKPQSIGPVTYLIQHSQSFPSSSTIWG